MDHNNCSTPQMYPPYPLVANVPLFPIFFLFPFFPFFLLLSFFFFFSPLSEEEEEETEEEETEEEETEEEEEVVFSSPCKEGAAVTGASLFASAKAETGEVISTLLVLPIRV